MSTPIEQKASRLLQSMNELGLAIPTQFTTIQDSDTSGISIKDSVPKMLLEVEDKLKRVNSIYAELEKGSSTREQRISELEVLLTKSQTDLSEARTAVIQLRTEVQLAQYESEQCQTVVEQYEAVFSQISEKFQELYDRIDELQDQLDECLQQGNHWVITEPVLLHEDAWLNVCGEFDQELMPQGYYTAWFSDGAVVDKTWGKANGLPISFTLASGITFKENKFYVFNYAPYVPEAGNYLWSWFEVTSPAGYYAAGDTIEAVQVEGDGRASGASFDNTSLVFETLTISENKLRNQVQAKKDAWEDTLKAGGYTKPPTIYAFLDIESYWGFVTSKIEGHRHLQQAIEEMVKGLVIAKEVWPEAKWSYYSLPTLGNNYMDYSLEEWVYYYTEVFKPVWDIIDWINPSIYDRGRDDNPEEEERDKKRVLYQVTAALTAASQQERDVPVFPFIWHRWFDNGPESLEMIDEEEFSRHLDYALSCECAGEKVHGFFWWYRDRSSYQGQHHLIPSVPKDHQPKFPSDLVKRLAAIENLWYNRIVTILNNAVDDNSKSNLTSNTLRAFSIDDVIASQQEQARRALIANVATKLKDDGLPGF